MKKLIITLVVTFSSLVFAQRAVESTNVALIPGGQTTIKGFDGVNYSISCSAEQPVQHIYTCTFRTRDAAYKNSSGSLCYSISLGQKDCFQANQGKKITYQGKERLAVEAACFRSAGPGNFQGSDFSSVSCNDEYNQKVDVKICNW